jgi:DNA-directed RNA polymerase specialized sigma24 family protein
MWKMDNKEIEVFITQLFYLHNNILLKTATRRLNNDINAAEDVTNELWVVATVFAEDLYNHPNKIAWLMKWLNICLKRYKYSEVKRIRKKDENGDNYVLKYMPEFIPLDDVLLNKLVVEENLYEGELFDEYKNILTDAEFEYIKMKYYDLYSTKEISLLKNKNYSAITSMGNRVKYKLKKYFNNK